MSSVYVRTQIKTFLTANASGENVIDLTSQSEVLADLITRKGLTAEQDWLGIDFIGSDEEIASVPANNTSGRYRERGSIYLHIVERAIPDVGDAILTRVETLRTLFRGRRINNDIVIESVTPPNTHAGATLQFEGGYESGSFIVNYYRDLNL